MDEASTIYLLINCGRPGFKRDTEILSIWTSERCCVKTCLELTNDEDSRLLSPNQPAILWYDDRKVDLYNERKCKETLSSICGKALPKTTKIFFHRGGANLAALSELVADFKRDFWDAHGVMPYSDTMELPWKKSVVEAGSATDFGEALEALGKAWNKANRFYYIERPIRHALDTLFPLYVDMNSHLSDGLEPADLHAAIMSGIDAWRNAEPDANVSADSARARVYESAWPAIDKCVTAAVGLPGSLEAGVREFVDAYKELSTVYTEILSLTDGLATAESSS